MKFSIEARTRVASEVISGDNLESGTITTCIPAARPDLTPFGESSNARHLSAEKKVKFITGNDYLSLKLLPGGTILNLFLATSKASGAGLPFLTSGSLPHRKINSKFEKNS